MNQRPPGYEPDELPTALPRDIQLLPQELIYNSTEDRLCQVFFVERSLKDAKYHESDVITAGNNKGWRCAGIASVHFLRLQDQRANFSLILQPSAYESEKVKPDAHIAYRR